MCDLEGKSRAFGVFLLVSVVMEMLGISAVTLQSPGSSFMGVGQKL